ncbi:MAG: hypothetical protein LBR73_05210 [Oscillospiraceae bacterium]|jgi:hypothetical protein|nr:hypothetical protein [Oscillospiraceae bacterium]
MNIRTIAEYDLGRPLGQVRSIPIQLGTEESVLFVFSAEKNVDPGEEYFHYPQDSLKIALFTRRGERLWEKDLGPDNIPGVWFVPVIAFDLDKDGNDEIYYVNNINRGHPFSIVGRQLQKLDARTGEPCGAWPWPRYTEEEKLSLCYRFYLACGYVQGEPVLITAQGCYTNMYLQAWNSGMTPRWTRNILDAEPGCRASHVCPVLDINKDGTDEILWGERAVSLHDGTDLFCCDRESFHGHSDIVIPFIDHSNDNLYIYTCREDDDGHGIPRVVVYDSQGNRVWTDMTRGHMHFGWLAHTADGITAMAARVDVSEVDGHMHSAEPIRKFYNAFTGEEAAPPVRAVPASYPIKTAEQGTACAGDAHTKLRLLDIYPIDFDGDSIDEFFDKDGIILNSAGEILARAEGEPIRMGKVFADVPGDQLMLFTPGRQTVQVWGCPETIESEAYKKRHSTGFHTFNQKLMATGYNNINSVLNSAM